jgi:hypothetical protein
MTDNTQKQNIFLSDTRKETIFQMKNALLTVIFPSVIKDMIFNYGADDYDEPESDYESKEDLYWYFENEHEDEDVANHCDEEMKRREEDHW